LTARAVRIARAATAALLCCGIAWAEDGVPESVAADPAPLRIAVVRFDETSAPGSADLDLAASLSRFLTQRLPNGVVEPAALDVLREPNPEARDVRAWAEQAGFDAVVFGRTSTGEGGTGLAVDVRSGHSGVTSASYEVTLLAGTDPETAVDGLAESILSGLGYTAPGAPAALAAAPEEPEGSSLTVLRKGEAISIRSDELEVTQDGDERHLVFSHAVRVEQGDVKLETDRLDAYYKAGESQPDRLVARGSVQVVHGERQARCDTATFYNEERRVTCKGHAELQQGCDLVRGEEIQFDLREERVRVVGAASVVIQGGKVSDGCTGDES
jgi:lipopolysaccharide export system protein LptA